MATKIKDEIQWKWVPFFKENSGTFWHNLGENKVSAAAKFALACTAVTCIGIKDRFPALTTLASTGLVGGGVALWLTECPHPTDAFSYDSERAHGRIIKSKEMRMLIDNQCRANGVFYLRSIFAGMLAGNCITLILNFVQRARAGTLLLRTHHRVMFNLQYMLLFLNASAFLTNLVWACKNNLDFTRPPIVVRKDLSVALPPERTLADRVKVLHEVVGKESREQLFSALKFALAAGLTFGVGVRHRLPRLHIFGTTLLFVGGVFWQEKRWPSPVQLVKDRLEYGYITRYNGSDAMIDKDWRIGPVGIRSFGFGLLAANLALISVSSARHFLRPSGGSLIPTSLLALCNGGLLTISLWTLTDEN